MGTEVEEHPAPPGILTGINFSVLDELDRERLAVMTVDNASEVTDPRLGLPNFSSQCSTCGSKDFKGCEGHVGVIKFQCTTIQKEKFECTIIHPYYLSEIAKILNTICPGCKSIKRNALFKGLEAQLRQRKRGCRYCLSNSLNRWYPSMVFKVSSKELFRRTTIVVEVSEKGLNKIRKRGKAALPADYWDVIPSDSQEQSSLKPTRRILTHAQIYHFLREIDPKFIAKFIPKPESLYLNSFPVTPNNQRVTELIHSFKGQRLMFDERTRAYKKLVGFKGTPNELSASILECLQSSKLYSETTSSMETANPYQKQSGSPKLCGLRFMKDVVLAKRNDNTFRTVVVGDPNLKLNEIGIPCRIAERLQVSEALNNWNWERLITCCDIRLLEKGEVHVRRKGKLVPICSIDKLQLGDNICRPLRDGDLILMNRPPSIHQHSFVALSVKVLPITSVVALNPLCCSPFRADFDGDCFHGYVPQSLEAKVELNELVALDKQLINKQSGRNLLSLGQDSLTAAYLVNSAEAFLDRIQIQNLQMYCPYVKAPLSSKSLSTGKQLLSMLLPPSFNFAYPSNDVLISDGELLSSSEGSMWLRDNDENIFHSLIKHEKGAFLHILYSGQEVLCQWLSNMGLSVSLADLYLCSDPQSRENLMEETSLGLQYAAVACNFRQLMVGFCVDLLSGNYNAKEEFFYDSEKLCCERQKSAMISQASVDTFKQMFRDIQTYVYKYAGKDNSLLVMAKSGSKGNIMKLVQQSMCLGLQHSLAPLSFRFPHKLTCDAWNEQKKSGGPYGESDNASGSGKFIPFAVIQNSFVGGLNPLESFAHSVTSRDSSFSDNADLPGTLTRRLMFFMRDIYRAYDGTIRNAYGNQIVQFSYEIDDDKDTVAGGEPVGSSAGCAVSEAAYSALDQPISLLESSPLLNLKDVLECGSKRTTRDQTVSLYLSWKLGRTRYGFEHGALAVKSHLEKLTLSEIVSTVMIIFSPPTRQKSLSPWVCHFHILKEIVKKKGLKVLSIIDSLNKRYISRQKEMQKLGILNLQITSEECLSDKELGNDTFCITVMIQKSNNSSIELDRVRDLVIPLLLETTIKGFLEIKKVQILWNDAPKLGKVSGSSSGELYLRVVMLGDSGSRSSWSTLMDNCFGIMDMIDWSRSHPEDIRQCCSVLGVDAGFKLFLKRLESAVSDTGKSILAEHLRLVASCLSLTGEFVGLNAKGWSKQRKCAAVASPFTQACFANPSSIFVKAAKGGVKDGLEGTIDALAWGRVPISGTGDQFDIISSKKNHQFRKPVDVYDLLGSTATLPKIYVPNAPKLEADKFGTKSPYMIDTSIPRPLKSLKNVSRSYLKNVLTWDDIRKLSYSLKTILHKYPIDQHLSDGDRTILKMALCFHPHRDEKIGAGTEGIKVGYHQKHKDARCFQLVRSDGTTEDFSYHKCVLGALDIIAPEKATLYRSKWLHRMG